MPFNKKTMRRMDKDTRQVAELHNEVYRFAMRLKRMVKEMQEIKLVTNADKNRLRLSNEMIHWPPCSKCGESLYVFKGERIQCLSCGEMRDLSESIKELE